MREKDINNRIARFQRMARNEKPKTIRQIQTGGGVSVGGGSAAAVVEYVKIIESLSYDVDDVPGQSSYVCRLVGSTEPEAFDGSKQDYVTGSNCLFNDRIYIASEDYEWSGIVEGDPPVVTTPAPNPPDDEANWQVSEELPVYIWDNPLAVPDMRTYMPILLPDEIYPVRRRRVAGESTDKYFWEIGFTYIGVPGLRSISWDIESGRMMACVSDTVEST